MFYVCLIVDTYVCMFQFVHCAVMHDLSHFAMKLYHQMTGSQCEMATVYIFRHCLLHLFVLSSMLVQSGIVEISQTNKPYRFVVL